MVILVIPRMSSGGLKGCTILPSEPLEVSIREKFFYRATFCPSSLPDINGVYDSLAACQSGSVSALTFDESCQPPAKSQSDSHASSNVEDSYYTEYFSQELKNILNQEIEDSGMAEDNEMEDYTSNSQLEHNLKISVE